jgi:hypothetical protein
MDLNGASGFLETRQLTVSDSVYNRRGTEMPSVSRHICNFKAVLSRVTRKCRDTWRGLAVNIFFRLFIHYREY